MPYLEIVEEGMCMDNSDYEVLRYRTLLQLRSDGKHMEDMKTGGSGVCVL